MTMFRRVPQVAPLTLAYLHAARSPSAAPTRTTAFPAAPDSWFDVVQREFLGDGDLNTFGDAAYAPGESAIFTAE